MYHWTMERERAVREPLRRTVTKRSESFKTSLLPAYLELPHSTLAFLSFSYMVPICFISFIFHSFTKSVGLTPCLVC